MQPTLRKKNKIKTIHSTLAIEGNTLTEDEITRILENRHVRGPKNEIIEVQNAIETQGLNENTFLIIGQTIAGLLILLIPC